MTRRGKKLLALLLAGIFLLFAACSDSPAPTGTSGEGEPTATPTVPATQWPEKLDYPYGDGAPEIDLYELNWLAGGAGYIHDPVIIREGDTWYAFGTGYSIPMYKSRDGGRFSDAGLVFLFNPEWHRDYLTLADDSLWAPDIIKWNGYYYLYYSVSTFGSNISVIGLARNKTLDSKSEDYEWEDLGPVINSTADDYYNCIDPNVVVDENGWPWLSFGSFWGGLKLIKLDPETMKPLEGEELHSIARREGSGAIEAPFITYRDGYYYLYASTDFCCRGLDSTYKIVVGRSESVTGPYLDRDGKDMMEGGGTLLVTAGEKYKGPGHCAVYQSGDTAILMYHAYSVARNGEAQMRIDKLYFDEEGWPYTETGLAD